MTDDGVQLNKVRWIDSYESNPQKSWNPAEDASILLESLTRSVADRLMSDVPLGIVLSGGLDSAMVAAISHEASRRTVTSPCWTVAESEDNPDWKAAEIVCQALDLEHHQHVLEGNAFNQSLPSLSWHGEDLDITVLFSNPSFRRCRNRSKLGCGQVRMSCMQGILGTRTSLAIDFQSIQIGCL